ncbi:MAG: winged helix-turn-helix domain-containing protein [Gemmatimonadaceae bacterium]
MRILLAEDDGALAQVVADGLREVRFEVACVASAPAARERALLGQFDVLVLDVMLVGGSGFDLCAELRRRGVATPILLLTARDAVEDRVRGLESGADDYLTKPFAFRELLARVRALVRRQPALAPQVVRVEDLEVDLRAHQVRRAGREVELTAREFALLEVLARHAGQVLDRATISAHVWDENHDPFTNVLEVLVRRLRRKVDDGHATRLIHTIRGAGYRLGR